MIVKHNKNKTKHFSGANGNNGVADEFTGTDTNLFNGKSRDLCTFAGAFRRKRLSPLRQTMRRIHNKMCAICDYFQLEIGAI